MTLSNKLLKVWKFARETFLITLGLALYGCAWNVFVLPHHFVGGGFGGISAMLLYLTGIPVYVSYIGFNIFLCAIALMILGKDFSIKTVFGILGLTFFLWAIPKPDIPPISDKLLSAIMGGIIGGAGVGCYLLQGASTGGSDIVVMIVSKYKNLSWGRVYLIFDTCVIASSYFLPTSTIETVAYGFVFMGVSTTAIDMVQNGRRQSVQMFIFTSRYHEIADQIIHKHHRGATLFESIGWYTKQHRKTIYLVARKREAQAIFKTVKAIDEHAFIAVSNVMSVFGIGFDPIKAGFTKPVLTDENGKVIDLTNQQQNADRMNKSAASDVIQLPSGIASIVPAIPDENLSSAPLEVPPDEEILTDEVNALRLEYEGKSAEYNEHWETPASEISTAIPEDE